jgi:curved DNA-binding protein CbpA
MKENWEINWKDYYKILQVHPSAEPEVIKAAHDKLALKYHPDVNRESTATQRMKDINEAYDILSNSEKRNRYHVVYLQRMGTAPSSFNNQNSVPPPTTRDKPTANKSSSHRLIVDTDDVDCPIKKEGVFPCPSCAYSTSIFERKAFLNTTTWWYCEFPDIQNFSKLHENEMTTLLKIEYRKQGYSLSKDDDFVYLRRNGKNCKVFSSHRISIATVEKYIASNIT